MIQLEHERALLISDFRVYTELFIDSLERAHIDLTPWTHEIAVLKLSIEKAKHISAMLSSDSRGNPL
jgi:hypothetical protein